MFSEEAEASEGGRERRGGGSERERERERERSQHTPHPDQVPILLSRCEIKCTQLPFQGSLYQERGCFWVDFAACLAKSLGPGWG
eukprot:417725-Rhodomonas_salina.1